MIRKAVGALLALSVISVSAEADDRAIFNDFMKMQLQKDARKGFDDGLAAFDKETERKRRAKESIPTAAQYARGVSALKFLVYNTTAIKWRCSSSMIINGSHADDSRYKLCVEAEVGEFQKHNKLQAYVEAIGENEYSKCHAASRDLDGEIAFPPYDFLSDHGGPPILKFSEMNGCVLSKLRR